MTLKQLQRYLETEKWRETAKRGADACGSYPRCAYCNRFDEYPCAEAYNRYLTAPVKEEGDWLLPEPPVKRVFGVETVSAPVPQPKEPAPKPVEKEREPVREQGGIPLQRLVRRADPRENVAVNPAPPVPPVLPKQAEEIAAETATVSQKGGVLTRARGRCEGTRVLLLTKKGNYGEAE